MGTRLAVTCDTPRCLALYAPAPGTGRAGLISTAVRHGWTSENGHTGPERCPSCSRGGGPVYERGDCPVCSGRRLPTSEGDRCECCGHLTPDTEGEIA